MNIKQTINFQGAQKVLIQDDRTGEMKDYSKIFYVNEADDDRDQVGNCPASFAINADLFHRISGLEFPVDLIAEIKTVSAGGGKTQLKIIDLKKPSNKASG